jgi:hypothetical protein
MNLAGQLMMELSRRNTDYIAHGIGNNPELFENLVELVFFGKEPLPSRASWVVSAVTDKYPELLKPYIKRIVTHIEKFDHPGTRRNLLRYLSDNKLPKSVEGKLYDVCFKWALSRNEPPGVKVYSVQILFNIAQKEPDLKNEVRLILEELIHHESAAIRNRCLHLMDRF